MGPIGIAGLLLLAVSAVEWRTDLGAALEDARAERRHVLLYVMDGV